METKKKAETQRRQWTGKRNLVLSSRDCKAGGEAISLGPEASIMETDDRQVTTVFTVQPIGTRHTEYHEALPSSKNDEVRCDCTFADEGNAS